MSDGWTHGDRYRVAKRDLFEAARERAGEDGALDRAAELLEGFLEVWSDDGREWGEGADALADGVAGAALYHAAHPDLSLAPSGVRYGTALSETHPNRDDLSGRLESLRSGDRPAEGMQWHAFHALEYASREEHRDLDVIDVMLEAREIVEGGQPSSGGE